MGIYVEQSQNTVNSTVANNSHLVLQGGYVYYQCVITSFLCFSNMTDVKVTVRYQTHHYDDPRHKVNLAVRSGLRMTVFNILLMGHIRVRLRAVFLLRLHK